MNIKCYPGPFKFQVLLADIERRLRRPPLMVELVEWLGISETTMKRLRNEGCDSYTADHFATRLGLHPAQIWGHEQWCAQAEAEDVA